MTDHPRPMGVPDRPRHTLGPWRVDPRVSTHIETDDGRGICSTGGYNSTREPADEIHAENEANARLIAAAPDLLGPARSIVERCSEMLEKGVGSVMHGDYDVYPLITLGELRALAAAVSKADGAEGGGHG